MRYPKALPAGGTIGFIAPSFGAATAPYDARFDGAKERFAAWGYKCLEGPNCRVSLGIGKSNTPEACGAEINDFFLRRDCDVIISCGGGETMCEDLPFVDLEAIAKADPKWYIGYSDNTNLTFLLPTLCDTAAVYGPNASDFGMEPWHPSIHDAFSVLTGGKTDFTNYDGWESGWPEREIDPRAPFNITESYEQRILIPDQSEKGYADAKEARFEGRLIGGCLDVLAGLVGTKFDRVAAFNEKYKEDGFIWFLESCDLNTMSIRRTLWHLKEAGWFKYVKGFLIGRPLQYRDSFGDYTPFEAHMDMLKSFGVPVIYGIDLGHLSPMIPFISGAYGKAEAVGNSFRIQQLLE